MNILKTTFFLTVLTLLLISVGGLLGGRTGMIIAFVFACVMNLGAYWFSDKMVLAMYRAKPLTEAEAPSIHLMVRELARRAEMPMPRLYRIPTNAANAFATGRNPQNAVVGVTDGILQLLTEQELEGVLAHELSHVKHRDILISSIAATIAGAIGMLASMARWGLLFGGGRGRGPVHIIMVIAMSILAPIAALLVQMAVSRSREYHADEAGARLCGNPEYLASALRKLAASSGKDPVAEENPATAHLFIVNPLKGKSIAQLFSTHPPMEERVKRLSQTR